MGVRITIAPIAVSSDCLQQLHRAIHRHMFIVYVASNRDRAQPFLAAAVLSVAKADEINMHRHYLLFKN
eukprot:SAG31_NODE_1292_length_8967_cov_2.998985_9_plen_69_part_00